MHTVSDQLAPAPFEATYAERVALAGSSPLLRQVYANAIGHCNFTDADMVAAIDAMNNVVAARHWTPGVTVTALNDAANALDPSLGGGNFTTDRPVPWSCRTAWTASKADPRSASASLPNNHCGWSGVGCAP